MKLEGLQPASVNHALNTLRSCYNWLRHSNGYPMHQLLPTNAIDLERQEEPQADHLEAEDVDQLWVALELEERTRVRDAFGTQQRFGKEPMVQRFVFLKL